MPARRTRVLAVALALVALTGVALFLIFRSSAGDDPAAAATAVERGAGPRLRADDDPAARTGAGVIEGRVLGADGRPVDGAHVALTMSGRRRAGDAPGPRRPAVRTATTTANGGRFHFGDLPPATYAVIASAREGAPGQSARLELAEGGRLTVDVRLGTGGVLLSGRLLDAGGGTIPGGKLMLVPRVGMTTGEGEPPRIMQVIADAGGAYAVSLRPGLYGANAQAPGYADQSGTFMLGAATVRDFRLAPGGRVSGRVIERGSGRPVGDAEVSLTSNDRSFGFTPPRHTKADAAGVFSFDELVAGNYQLEARKGALIGKNAQLVAVGIAQVHSNVDVAVSRAAVVRGRVVAAGKDAPVPGARVHLFEDGILMARPHTVETGADGSFVVEGVLPGKYRVDANADEHGRAFRPLEVGTSDVNDVRLELPAGGVITGRVLDREGRPVEGASVSAMIDSGSATAGSLRSMENTRSGADGSYALDRFGAGRITVVAQKEDLGIGSAGPEMVAGGERKRIDVKLGKGAYVMGTVRHDDGTPAAGVTIGARSRDSRGAPPHALSGADGTFRIGPLPGGTVTVSADRRSRVSYRFGSDPPNQKTLTLAADEEKSGVELVVEKGGHHIAGIVLGPDGQPVGLATVLAEIESGGRAQRSSRAEKTFSSADGTFSYDDLAAGSYTVWAIHPDYPDGEVKSIATGTRGARIQLPRDAVVSGTVVDGTGRPVPAFTLMLLPGAAPDETHEQRRRRRMQVWDRPRVPVNDPGGAFTMRRVVPGTHELAASAVDGRTGYATFTIAAGERKPDVRLTLAAGVRITGRVIELESKAPMPGLEVRSFGPAGSQASATTGRDGAFVLENVASAEHITIYVAGDTQTHVPENKPVKLADGATSADAGTIALMRGNYRERAESGLRSGSGLLVAPDEGSGALVRSVRGPAEEAGLKRGDRVLQIDGKDMAGLGHGALNFLLMGKPGTTVTVTVASAGAAPRTVTITRADERPRP